VTLTQSRSLELYQEINFWNLSIQKRYTSICHLKSEHSEKSTRKMHLLLMLLLKKGHYIFKCWDFVVFCPLIKISSYAPGPCWASMVNKTTNIAALCCPFPLPQPDQRGFSTLCRVKKKQPSPQLDVTLNALINVSVNGPDRTVARTSSIEGL